MGGGTFDTVCPIVCKWVGAAAPLSPPPPGSAAYGRESYLENKYFRPIVSV